MDIKEIAVILWTRSVWLRTGFIGFCKRSEDPRIRLSSLVEQLLAFQEGLCLMWCVSNVTESYGRISCFQRSQATGRESLVSLLQ
jgi:hypothetical protein